MSKVAVIYNSLNPGGGAEKVAVTLCNVASELQSDVTLYLLERPQKKIFAEYLPYLSRVKIKLVSGEFLRIPHFGGTAFLACLEFYANVKHRHDVTIDAAGIFTPLSCMSDMVYVHSAMFQKVFLDSQIPGKRIYGLALDALGSPVKTILKKEGKSRRVVAANSEYTRSMIKGSIDSEGDLPVLLYPPVDVRHIMNEVAFGRNRTNTVITVSRISPEKNLEIIPEIAKELKNIEFVVMGRLRDSKSLECLLRRIKMYGLSNVKIMLDVNQSAKMKLLQEGKVYLHTMQNEDFGISIVEGMASGLIPVIHDSGGPREYVPKEQRYRNIAEAVNRIKNALSLWTPAKASEVASSVLRFDTEEFSKKTRELVSLLL